MANWLFIASSVPKQAEYLTGRQNMLKASSVARLVKASSCAAWPFACLEAHLSMLATRLCSESTKGNSCLQLGHCMIMTSTLKSEHTST